LPSPIAPLPSCGADARAAAPFRWITW
jgi:hypothetical protein